MYHDQGKDVRWKGFYYRREDQSQEGSSRAIIGCRILAWCRPHQIRKIDRGHGERLSPRTKQLPMISHGRLLQLLVDELET
jgi:hypothetical protein